MAEGISVEELSRWSGEPVETLSDWLDRGLLGGPEAEGYSKLDIERARLVRLALDRGVRMETLESVAARVGGLMWAPYSDASRPVGRRLTRAEAGAQVSIEPELLQRIWQATSLAAPDEMMDEADLQMVSILKVALDAGFPEEALLQAVRVYVDGFGKIAEAETRLFHYYVHDRLRATGLAGPEVNRLTQEASSRLYELVEPALLYFHRKSMVRAAREDTLASLLAEQAGTLGGGVPGQMSAAIVFLDISSFTPLTDAMGDIEAARILGRFSDLVRESTNLHQGRVVKQIGDEFMLVFSDARSAVACAIEVEQRAAEEPQFTAIRGGVHWGQVLYREGDYVGANVNIASRIAGEANRHQLVVSSEVRREAAGLEGVEFIPLGKRRLRGVADELLVFEARSLAAAERTRVLDPVCGMELTGSEVAARLSLDGEERVFCSEDCLRRFVASPDNYQPAR